MHTPFIFHCRIFNNLECQLQITILKYIITYNAEHGKIYNIAVEMLVGFKTI
jgi:hypothetical protein